MYLFAFEIPLNYFLLFLQISRESIDVVKEFYRGDLNKEDWKLVMELKKMLAII